MRKSNTNTYLYKTAGTVMSLLGFILIFVPLIASLFLIVPRILGFHEFTVISGSMEPTIPVGSMILVKPADIDDIKEGDIISYYTKFHSDVVVTHRVSEVDRENGKLTTKGDANDMEDVNTVSISQVIGVVVFCLPNAGIFLGRIISVPGIVLILTMFISGFILTTVGEKIRDDKKSK
ncbi:MAG: signal peptidase I [Oscillospiraceae bacterium]|nr:signal peptidase I [Oscillospiraceae bacterium]MBR0452032.1 signal peptidase I [Oscillospiraceae bacterium]